MTGLFHGGDLAAASRAFGDPPDGWLDLSTGINPQPWPVPAGSLESLHRLPDGGALEALRQAAATAYGIADPDRVACGPGSQALIQWLPQLREASRVVIVAPTYGEHAPAWRAAGHDVNDMSTLPVSSDFDIAVLTRPNNPDGAVADASELVCLASDLATTGGILVVDEAFADLDPAPSLAAELPAGVVALRSFGKFYGLPGLRLGFTISDPDTAKRMTEAMGPWAVSSLAAEIGVKALLDTEWQCRTRVRLTKDVARLDLILLNAGLEILGGTDLFRLTASEATADYHARLGRAGIYTRRFPDNPAWLRFGLPGDESGWDRLEKAFES